MFERIVGKAVSPISLVLVAVTLASCSEDDPIGPLPVTTQISLAPAGSIVADSLAGGAVGFPAATAAGAEYLVVAQLTGLQTGQSSSFSLTGQGQLVAPVRLTQFARRQPSVAERFHGMLRMRERDIARRSMMNGSLLRSAPERTPPPTVGHQRTFKVCSNLSCSATTNVPATARFVGTHAAIYTDDANPANGFTQQDLDEVGTQFDDVLYPIATDAFGNESDIDANTVVVVLLSKAINALVPKPDCNDAFIAGYFFGADLDPFFAAQYNNGEVFYGMVPDPAGSATQCAYSTTFVKRIIPVTFIHEFQHMISFNEHVLARGGQEEVLWLNEAMSHLAEELGGDYYHGIGDDFTATRFYVGNMFNAYQYLTDPGAHAVVTDEPPGSLEERGGGWLMLRYLVDRFGPTVTQSLTQTALTGEANVQAATGQSFEELMGYWMMAVYLTDLPGFTAPPELSFASWSFRDAFGSLHQQDPANFPLAYPLEPAASHAETASISGTVSSGSGSFMVLTQASSGPPFSLAFRASNGAAQPASSGPQLAIARIR